MQPEKLACGKIVPRDLFRGPFHTTTQCESGTFYDARRLFWVLPLSSVLHSRLLVAINAKSFLHQVRIRRLPAVEEKPSICVTCTVKHLQEVLSFIKNSSKKWSKIKTDGKQQRATTALRSTDCTDGYVPGEVFYNRKSKIRMSIQNRSPPTAHLCPFHLNPPRAEQPWLKIQLRHLQNQPVSGLRVNINYPGVSNTSSWSLSLLISSTREKAHY